MYRNRWKEYGQSDPMGNNLNKIFIKNLIRYFIGSKLHFSGLFLEGKPISYHIGFLFNNCFFYYKPTFDVEYSNYFVGHPGLDDPELYLRVKKGKNAAKILETTTQNLTKEFANIKLT